MRNHQDISGSWIGGVCCTDLTPGLINIVDKGDKMKLAMLEKY